MATITQLSVNMPQKYRKLKVAAYARVSTRDRRKVCVKVNNRLPFKQ